MTPDRPMPCSPLNNDPCTTPVVSVIIITYNQEATIGRAIESVLLQQTPFPYEIVIGDDCSTDDTCMICRQYTEKYPDIVRLLPSSRNVGLVENYFRCLQACRGEFVSDCAGDDQWMGNEKLSYAVATMSTHTGVNVVYSDFEIVKGKKVICGSAYSSPPYSRWRRDFIPGKELLPDILNHVNALPYVLSTAVYRKAPVMNALAENREMVCNPQFGCEDVPLMAALANTGDAKFNPDVTFRYFLGEETASNSADKLKSAAFYLKALGASRMLARHYDIPLTELNDIYIAKTRFIASAACRGRDFKLMQSLTSEMNLWPIRQSLKVKIYRLAMKLVGMVR